jgi:hypothetical protein
MNWSETLKEKHWEVLSSELKPKKLRTYNSELGGGIVSNLYPRTSGGPQQRRLNE